MKTYIASFPPKKGAELPVLTRRYFAASHADAKLQADAYLKELRESGKRYNGAYLKKGVSCPVALVPPALPVGVKPAPDKPVLQLVQDKAPDKSVSACKHASLQACKPAFSIESINAMIDRLFPGELLQLDDVPDSIYHATKGYGSSIISEFAENQAKAKHTIDGHREEKDYYDVGSAVHCKMLEGERFYDSFTVVPENIKQRRGKEWEAFKAINEDKIILKRNDWKTAHDMSQAALLRHGQYFTGGKAETSYWKKDVETGLIIKARLDYRIGNIAVDLKTAANANPDKFMNTRSYFIQDAMYTDVTGVDEFVFVVVEKEAPYLSFVGRYNDEDKYLAYQVYRDSLRKLKVCLETGHWLGYADQHEIVELSIPYYKRKQLEQKVNNNE